jgi:hemerythrin
MKSTAHTIAAALYRAHGMLLHDLEKLEAAVEPESGRKIEDIRPLLAATQAHLLRHFRFEEYEGYMDLVRTREPRLERAVQHLAEEHQQLANSLSELITEADRADALSDTFRAEVQAWLARVHGHEVRENELVQDAFSLDLGAKD